MKDKFEIFQYLIFKEKNMNNYGCYITIGQLADLMRNVNDIYDAWDDEQSFEQNINDVLRPKGELARSISPLGNAGKNRL